MRIEYSVMWRYFFYDQQDNHSRSSRGVLRGLHYQVTQPQGKLVRAVAGSIYDVAVDIRKDSATFKQWFGVELSADNKKQLWIPPGPAHGFLVTSDSADVLYKTTDYWAPEHERTILWSAPPSGSIGHWEAPRSSPRKTRQASCFPTSRGSDFDAGLI